MPTGNLSVQGTVTCVLFRLDVASAWTTLRIRLRNTYSLLFAKQRWEMCGINGSVMDDDDEIRSVLLESEYGKTMTYNDSK